MSEVESQKVHLFYSVSRIHNRVMKSNQRKSFIRKFTQESLIMFRGVYG